MRIPRNVADDICVSGGTELVQISRAELETMHPGSDTFMFPVEVFKAVTQAGDHIVAYLPEMKVWQVLSYKIPDNIFWSRIP